MTRVATMAAILLLALPGNQRVKAQGDLDALMQRVLSKRDENWKKLQQYILDERESVDLRGPRGAAIWADEREYTWFERDGHFLRSPVKANGVTVSEADRRQYEVEFAARERVRDARAARAREDAGAPPAGADTPADINGLIRQSRQPGFISSAYFLRFRFDEGRYAFVGKEQLEGREALRIEYYPTQLFPQDRRGPGRLGANPVDAETRRLLNKVALVTLWIDPASDQILKYTFDNIALDFLPARWLVQVDAVTASMTMGQPFSEVWLPRDVQMQVHLSFASGDFDAQYHVNYHDYRRADVNTTFTVPQER